jgi:hypothetical protein
VTAIATVAVAPAATIASRGLSPSTTAQFAARPPSPTECEPGATPERATVLPVPIGCVSVPSSRIW